MERLRLRLFLGVLLVVGSAAHLVGLVGTSEGVLADNEGVVGGNSSWFHLHNDSSQTRRTIIDVGGCNRIPIKLDLHYNFTNHPTTVPNDENLRLATAYNALEDKQKEGFMKHAYDPDCFDYDSDLKDVEGDCIDVTLVTGIENINNPLVPISPNYFTWHINYKKKSSCVSDNTSDPPLSTPDRPDRRPDATPPSPPPTTPESSSPDPSTQVECKYDDPAEQARCVVNGIPNKSGLSVADVIKKVVNALAYIVAVSAVIVMMVQGLRMSVSGGDSQTFNNARNGILYAVAGLVVALFSSKIVEFALNLLT